jgi:hypothetical protein
MPLKNITALLVDDHVMVCEALASSVKLPHVDVICAFDVEQVCRATIQKTNSNLFRKLHFCQS